MINENKTKKQLIYELEELRQRIAELEISEARYRNIIESARNIIFTFSLDGKITSLNPAFETITGWSRADCIGKNFKSIDQSLVHRDDSPSVIDIYHHILNGEPVPQSLELRIFSKSGEY